MGYEVKLWYGGSQVAVAYVQLGDGQVGGGTLYDAKEGGLVEGK